MRSRPQRPTDTISALALAPGIKQPELEPGFQLAHSCILNIEENKESEANSLFDTGATAPAFIDYHYAQTNRIPFLPLSTTRKLLGFDGKEAASGLVTHFARIPFRIPQIPGPPIVTEFFITTLPSYDVVIGLRWMEEQYVSIQFSPRGNYLSYRSDHESTEPEPAPVLLKDPNSNLTEDDQSPEHPLATGTQASLTEELTPTIQALHHEEERRRTRCQKNPIAIALQATVTLPEPPQPSTKPLEVYMIGAAPFVQLSKDPKVELFAATMADIEKALGEKEYPDPKTLVPSEYHDYLDVFSRDEADKLPPHRGCDHKIQVLPGKEPGFGPLYGMSQNELKVLKKYLDDNLAKGFIRPSKSPAASPVLFARKPGGGLRLCVDYRALNAITIKNRYPLPLIQETLARICRAKVYTTLDIIAAFNKIRMAEGEEWKTAFRTRYGLFESMVMNFGLCGAPSTFQNYINDVLHDYLDDFCTAYIDDILVYSENRKKHTKHVRMILQRLRDAGLQVDVQKCSFGVTEVRYLGLIITTKGVQMDMEKVSAVLDWAIPKTVKDVQAFLGFANFYRRFIQGFSRLAYPLTQLTKKDQPFKWTPKCQEAFNGLKKAFTSAPILLHFDPEKQVVVETDASDHVVAGVLSQYDEAGALHPVAYFSTKMLPAECNYEIYDKELLAVIRAFELWRPELEGTEKPVVILSDHKNLEYFMTTKLLSRRQARWSEFLSRFNFKITYRPGGLNRRADALTRQSGDLPKGEDDSRRQYQWQTILKPGNLDIQAFQPPDEALKLRSILSLAPFSLAASNPEASEASEGSVEPEEAEDLVEEAVALELALEQAYETDEWTQEVLKALREGAHKMKGVPLAELEERHGRIYFQGTRMLIPHNDDLRLRILRLAHDSPNAGHPGRAKQYDIIRRAYWWPRLLKNIKRFVRNCHGCARSKISQDKYHGLLKPLEIPNRRWAHLSMDFIVGLPVSKDHFGRRCTNILVVTDRLTKMVRYIPMDKMDALSTARAFYLWIWKDFGFPLTTISDRGTQFVSDFWYELCKLGGTQAILSTAYHPETDGQTERANAILEQYLRAYVAFLQDDWAMWLPSAEFASNNHSSETIGVSPFFANSGQHPRMGFEPVVAFEDPTAPPDHVNRTAAEAFATKMTRIDGILQEQMVFAQANQAEFADRHRQPGPKYKAGDQVWLDARNLAIEEGRTRKLANKFEGPFAITEIISSHAYRLELPADWTCHDVFHTNLLRPASSDPLPGQVPPPPQPYPSTRAGAQQEYLVDAIISAKMPRGQLYYRVKWTNSDAPSTQEPFNHVCTATDAMTAFYERYPDAVGRATWNQYLANPNDPQFDSDDDPDDASFIPDE